MKTLREAAQLALEALEMHNQHYECDDSFYSCPAHEENDWREGSRECTCGADEANAAIIALQAALEQEVSIEQTAIEKWRRMANIMGEYHKPLTEEALMQIWDTNMDELCRGFNAFKHVARAIEAAHGIKESE